MNLLEHAPVLAGDKAFTQLHADLCAELNYYIPLVTPDTFIPLTPATWATTDYRRETLVEHPDWAADIARENERLQWRRERYHQEGTLNVEASTGEYLGKAQGEAYLAAATGQALVAWLQANGWQVQAYSSIGYEGDTTGVPYCPPTVSLHLQAKVLSPAAQAYQAQLAARKKTNLQLIHTQLPAMVVRQLRSHLPTTQRGMEITLSLRMPHGPDEAIMSTDPARFVTPPYLMPAYVKTDLWPEFTAKRIPRGWRLKAAKIDGFDLNLTLQRAA